MYYLPYNKNIKEFSRYLRSNSTLSEVLLWNELKAKRIKGYQFNRQKPLDNYIVDFYCKNLNLVIEVDGESHYHDDAPLRDAVRQSILESMGLKFLRFDDLDVKKDINSVVLRIYEFIDDFESLNPPNPL